MATKKKKRKKKNNQAMVVVILLISVVVVVLLAVGILKLRSILQGSAATAIAVEDTLGSYYSGTVVIARDETLVSSENMTSIDFVADEGSKVSRGSVICKVYSSGFNQTEINRLAENREKIQNFHVNQVFSDYVDAELDNENAEIFSLAQQVRTLVQDRGVGSLSNLEKQLESALSVRKSYLRQKYPDDQELSQLYKEESDQLKKIESWTTTHTATEDCLISFYTDGYENQINASTVAQLTPSDVRNVIRGVAPEQDTVARASSPIYRTVDENGWYALFLCSDKDWNPVIGETYQLQLTGFDNYVRDAQVEYFTRIGNDLLLRMYVDSSVEPVLNIRSSGATVGDFVQGFRVPINAIYTMDNMIGVVVLEGGVQTFVEVIVVSYIDENTALVRPKLTDSPLEHGKTLLLF